MCARCDPHSVRDRLALHDQPAEIERLTRERDDARRWAVRLEQMMFSERDAGYELLKTSLEGKPLFNQGAMSDG